MGKHRTGPRIPPEVDGIQVNFCKDPRCYNFGVPPSEEKQPRGRGAATKMGRDDYTLGQKREQPIIICQKCEASTGLKSNLAVAEEFARLKSRLNIPGLTVSCPNPDCTNTARVDDWPFRYQRYGKTSGGADRFLCTKCRKTFSIPYPDKPPQRARQRVHGYKNIEVFKELVNKVPGARICEIRDISYKTLYDKIRFIHKQCLLFAADRERTLPGRDLGELSC